MSTNRSAARDLLDLAAAGATITKADLEDVDTPEGLTRANFERAVLATAEECQQMNAEGRMGDARRHAAEVAAGWDIPEAAPFRHDLRGLDADELADLVLDARRGRH